MDSLKQSSSGPQGQQPPPRSSWITQLIWLLLAILLLSWFLPSLLGQSGSQNNETVTYSTFVGQIAANNVRSVTITDYTVTGVFKSSVPSADGTTKSTYFTVTVPQFGNNDLITLLEEHQVAIDVQPSNSGSTSFWLDVLFSVGPIVLLVLLFWWMSRRMSSTQSGIFSLGKSQARLEKESLDEQQLHQLVSDTNKELVSESTPSSDNLAVPASKS